MKQKKNSLSDNERLNKIEESWDVLARRALIGEESIVAKCKESGQVAGRLTSFFNVT